MGPNMAIGLEGAGLLDEACAEVDDTGGTAAAGEGLEEELAGGVELDDAELDDVEEEEEEVVAGNGTLEEDELEELILVVVKGPRTCSIEACRPDIFAGSVEVCGFPTICVRTGDIMFMKF